MCLLLLVAKTLFPIFSFLLEATTAVAQCWCI